MATNAPQPFGLKPVDTILSNNYSGQLATFLIKSGYPQNIFQGDPVILAGAADTSVNAVNGFAGYIMSLYDPNIATANASQTTPIFGVFQGVSYSQPSNFNGIDPSYNGRSYWAANTTTLNNVPAVAQVCIDPNVVYQVLCNTASPITQAAIGKCANIVFDQLNNIVQGNFQSGQSKVAVDLPTFTTNTRNVYTLGIAPTYPNVTSPSAIQPTGAYPVLNVILQNSQFAQRNASRT